MNSEDDDNEKRNIEMWLQDDEMMKITDTKTRSQRVCNIKMTSKIR